MRASWCIDGVFICISIGYTLGVVWHESIISMIFCLNRNEYNIYILGVACGKISFIKTFATVLTRGKIDRREDEKMEVWERTDEEERVRKKG